MEKLKILLSQVDFNIHRKIYTHLDTHILTSSSYPAMVPPPSVMIYAIKRILHPYVLWSEIPQLLDLLTNIDLFRQHAVKSSIELLDQNAPYKEQATQDSNLQCLRPSQENKLVIYTNRDEVDRQQYIVLVQLLCHQYIYYLWTAPSEEARKLPGVLNEMFPDSFQMNEQFQSFKGLFHHDLSEDEKEELRQSGERIGIWMQDVTKWEKERESQMSKKGLPPDKIEDEECFNRDFETEFPPPLNEKQFVDSIESYLHKVERMIVYLEKHFPRRTDTIV